jgi:hypothetical protein
MPTALDNDIRSPRKDAPRSHCSVARTKDLASCSHQERAHPRPRGCALFLCAAERKSASEPPAPKAGCHPPWMHAAHLSEARGELRLACFAKQIGVALGVVSKMGFRVHGSSFPLRKTCREIASFHVPSSHLSPGRVRA